jgi:hypothetical protein
METWPPLSTVRGLTLSVHQLTTFFASVLPTLYLLDPGLRGNSPTL